MTDSSISLSEADSTACCGSPPESVPPPRDASVCPHCRMAGQSVSGQTVKAMLAISLRTLSEREYRFCRTPHCAVVYFAADHSHVATVDHIREPVYQKRPDDDTVLVCYCFRYTAVDIRHSKAPSSIVDDITTGIHAGQCACDLRNPQGVCCLGNVRELLRHSVTGAAREYIPQ